MKKNNITHLENYKSIEAAVASLKKKIIGKKLLSKSAKQERLNILNDLSHFLLGKHIILTGGANGIWTDYMISPEEHLEEGALYKGKLSVIEYFLLFKSPVVLAQRELTDLSKKIATQHLGNGKTLASIPCGLMRDLMSLDFSYFPNTQLIGIDLDNESIEAAKKLAEEKNLSNVNFYKKDAWSLNEHAEFDFINSIGLNMYEKNPDAVITLYKNLYNALKPSGTLFTGVLTYPPYINDSYSDWILSEISELDLHLEKLLNQEILEIKWLNFRRLNEIKEDFKQAGFKDITVIEDSRRIFPAIVAKK